MAWAANIILLMLSISFFLYLGGYANSFAIFACEVGGDQVSSVVPGGCSGVSSLYDEVNLLLLVLIPVSAAVAIIFPNRYAIYAPIGIFFLGFFTFPIGIFGSVDFPPIAALFLMIFYGAAYLFAILDIIMGSAPVGR